MKTWFKTLLFAASTALALSGCEKDEERLVVQPGGPLTLTASAPTVALNSTDAAKDAVTFSWSPASYGYSAAITYTLQVDKKGGDFKAPSEFAVGNATKKTFTVADFNALLIKLGVAAGSAGQVDARVKSDVSPSVTPILSGTSTVSGTPYLVVIQYAALYVPGAYQGWTPAKAPSIVSVKDDKVYEGYVNFPDAVTEFKLTDTPTWDKGIFGDEKGGTTGIIVSPGDNFKVTGAGYYLLKADLNAKKWSATKTTWGIIGSATPKGWDADTPLTYDAASGTWKTTIVLKDGEIKFRANSDWGINFGDTKADGLLDAGGDNIAVKAGTYVLALNLSVGGNYTFTLTKQ